tara:strand:+ start:7533 stop:7892 length:360 start_codon:yes stop_codon:yes gene_type:complete
MKTISFLVFNKNGEISQNSIKCSTIAFDFDLFTEYKHYKKYDEYIILYNIEPGCKNLTVFYFTGDKYTSDVALLKINNNEIKNLTYKKYIKQISKIKVEPNDYFSDSDSDIEDISPFVY